MKREQIIALIAEAWNAGFEAAKAGCRFNEQHDARAVYLADVEFDAVCERCKAELDAKRLELEEREQLEGI